MSLWQAILSYFRPQTSGKEAASPRILRGDGSWPFAARIDGEDIVVENVMATAFGGANDPQDNGETASGINTKHFPFYEGCALPMITPSVPVLRGSPIPKMPFKTTMVAVTYKDKTITVPIIDIGPGRQASREGYPAHAIDLTVAAAKRFVPTASATNFSIIVSYRIIGGAKYAV